MELLNSLIIGGAVFFIFLLWVVVGVRHLRFLKSRVREQWEVLLERLAKRSDLLPNLMETVRGFDSNCEVVVDKMIEQRARATHEYNPGAKKMEYENDLTNTINEMISMGKRNRELGRDTNFLELKKEIHDIEQNAELQTQKYNEMVREYNSSRKSVFLGPLAFFMGYKVENIFDVEE